MKTIEWFGLYRANWSAAPLVPEAYSHPAKVAFGLAEKIYKHMLEQGYIEPGATVGDPFGGIAGFSFHAMLNGLNWIGVELEPRFCELAQQNIDLWNERYKPHFPNWGTARIMQGDSRQFLQHVAGVGGVVSSAPFAESLATKPPNEDYHRERMKRRGRNPNTAGAGFHDYGRTPGQLGAMPEGDINETLSAVVSSPAYADTINGSGEGPGARFDHVHHNGENATKKSSNAEYGRTPGNLGNLSGVVSSAPFEKSLSTDNVTAGRKERAKELGVSVHTVSPIEMEKLGKRNQEYGDHPANIGNDTGESFWSAAAVIVAQAYQALKPGAYAAWVCGDYVRNGERVYFGKQWLELCEAVGFEAVEWAIAWKREPGPVQKGIIQDIDKSIDRVSFFRNLANAKGAARALWGRLDKQAQDYYLATVSLELWQEYRTIEAGMSRPEMPEVISVQALAEYEANVRRYESITKRQKNNKAPTPSKIKSYAQLAAWADNERPSAEIEVLNEDVIFVRKPE